MDRYCPYCGVLLHTDAPFCSSCGAAISDGNLCKNCGNPLQAGMRFCPRCGTSCGGARHIQHFPPAAEPVHPMKWFYFLIYFGLWAPALYFFVRGIVFLTVGFQGDATFFIYPALLVYYKIGGIVQLAFAAYLIYTRFQLSNFRLRGPKLLALSFLIDASVGALSLIALCIIGQIGFGLPALFALVLSFVIDSALYFANRDYFTTRAKLFIY